MMTKNKINCDSVLCKYYYQDNCQKKFVRIIVVGDENICSSFEETYFMKKKKNGKEKVRKIYSKDKRRETWRKTKNK